MGVCTSNRIVKILRNALEDLTDATLDRLANAGIITSDLRTATKSARFRFLGDPPNAAQTANLDQKATNALRSQVLTGKPGIAFNHPSALWALNHG